jgi:hypothetical protein
VAVFTETLQAKGSLTHIPGIGSWTGPDLPINIERRRSTLAASRWYQITQLLVLVFAMASGTDAQILANQTPQLRVIEVKEADGQILSYRHLAGSTEVHMRGTRLAPKAQIKLKIGSRPGFVELDINRGGISGLQPAHRLGKDFLTYVLWAVSVDGKASNLGEVTFENDRPVPVNLTTPYQTFWLMVTAEPNYAVVDPSAQVVLYSVKQPATSEHVAQPIKGDLFFFTHYASYETAPSESAQGTPNQLLQARKAVELASKSGMLTANVNANRRSNKEDAYALEAFRQAETFLRRSEAAYKKNPHDQAVVQFARTSAQSAENARALAMGAVGDLRVRQLESELTALRDELSKIKNSEGGVETSAQSRAASPASLIAATPVVQPLIKQPALWFAVAGWAVAVVLLFRRRSI